MFSKDEDKKTAPASSNFFTSAQNAAGTAQTTVVETTTKVMNAAAGYGKQAGDAVCSGAQQAGAYVQTLKPGAKAEEVKKTETKDENADGVIGGAKKFAAGLMK